MDLTLSIRESGLSLEATCPTVVKPGDDIRLSIRVQSTSPYELISMTWKTPASIFPDPISVQLPVMINTQSHLDITQRFTTNAQGEDFGLIEAELIYRAPGSPADRVMRWAHWISVFHRTLENNPAGLSLTSRKKLVEVTNTRVMNGFLLMADFIRYFDQFLNIEIPGSIAGMVSKSLDLFQEELPLDEESFDRIARGELGFYGIEELELIPEEECVESDDRFDPEALKEIRHPDIDI